MDKTHAKALAINAAVAYRDIFGLAPVPLYGVARPEYDHQKRPVVKDWTKYEFAPDTWPRDACAVGVICGQRSSNLFVLDFESMDSFAKCEDHLQPLLEAGKGWLATTRKGFHAWFWSEHLIRPMGGTKMTRGLAFEIRGEGQQIVAPPSIMTSGDEILPREFRMRTSTRPPALTAVDTEQLIARTLTLLGHPAAHQYRLVSGAHHFDEAPMLLHDDRPDLSMDSLPQLLATTWPRHGARHEMILALAGEMFRKRIPLVEARAAIEKALRHVQQSGVDPALDDTKRLDLLRAVDDTYRRADSRPVTGRRRLTEILGTSSSAETGAGAAARIAACVQSAALKSDEYFVSDGKIFWNKRNGDGITATELANFTARIVSDIVEDDGADERRQFEIEACAGGKSARLAIPATKFPLMNWPTEYLGSRASIAPGHGLKDRARAAVQALSTNFTERRIYRHTGWRKIGDAWTYLHAGGGLAAAGAQDGIEVSLAGKFTAYRLPGVALDPTAMAKNIGQLLELAPDRIILPCLAAVFRAPLAEAFACPFSVFLAGASGVFKSELAGLLQGFFGAEFSGTNLPASWKDTANRIERSAFLAKDALFCIDDFAPCGPPQDIARYHREADLIFRGAGNQAGRGRLSHDGSDRPTYSPRGLILGTGEDVPRGKSLRGRMLIIEISEGDIDVRRLTDEQRKRANGDFAAIMSRYVQWLSGRMARLKEELPELHRRFREEASQNAAHRRTPDIVAHLLLGLKCYLDFIDDDSSDLWDRALDAFSEIARAQRKWIRSEDPAERFLSLLAAVIVAGRGHVANAKGVCPEEPERWGWRSGVPLGERLGWIREDGFFLQPEVVITAVQKMSRDEGSALGITSLMLKRALFARGLLLHRDERRDTYTVRVRLDGGQKEVLHLAIDVLENMENKSNVGNVGKSEGYPCLEKEDLPLANEACAGSHPTRKPDISDTPLAAISEFERYAVSNDCAEAAEVASA